jgi:hypothetical protein
VPDWPNRLGRWLEDLPGHAVRLAHPLAHLMAALWRPWLPVAALAVVVAGIAVRVATRVAWRRAVAGGYWLAVTPPRKVNPSEAAAVWSLLRPLAVRAGGGWWRLARPPLAFEVYSDGRTLRAGLWLPGWVPPGTAEDIVTNAWPGAVVSRTDPPALAGGPAGSAAGAGASSVVAGVRLAPDPWHPQTGWLVNDIRPRGGSHRGGGPDADLGAVLAGLATPDAATVLQVLVRPATARRLRHLAAAGQRPVKPLRVGWQLGLNAVLWTVAAPFRLVVALWDWCTTTAANSSGTSRRQPPRPEQREAMGVARDKLSVGQHMLAAVRIGAATSRRRAAREAAQTAGYGYAVASRLRIARLRRPAAVLAARWAGSAGWLLVTPAELAVLAHLPPDPGRYGFDTAALHRAHPGGVFHADPERPTDTMPGWNRDGWTRPPVTTAADHDNDIPHHRDTPPDQHHPAERHHRAGVPAPRTTPYLAADDHDTDDQDTDDQDTDDQDTDDQDTGEDLHGEDPYNDNPYNDNPYNDDEYRNQYEERESDQPR